MELPIEPDDVAARRLLPYAADVRGRLPAGLRDLVVERARAVVALYG